MKRIVFTIFIIMLLCFPIVSKAVATNSSDDVNLKIYFFYEDDCKDCDSAREWIEEYLKDNSDVGVEYLNTKENKELNKKVIDALDIKDNDVPLIVVGTNYFVGYNDNYKDNVKSAIKSYKEKESYCDLVSKIKNNDDYSKCVKQNDGIYKQDRNTKNNIVIPVIIGLIVIIGIVIIFKAKKAK